MSDPGQGDYQGDYRGDYPDREEDRFDDGDGGRGRRRGCGAFSCLAVLVALAVLVGGGYLALTRGVEALQDRLGGPADFAGPGTGRVLVEVREGDTGSDIATTLKDKGVVKSVAAFTDAFEANEDATSIQVGFYELQRQMRAEDAIAVMVDPDNLIQTIVTIPEGLRVVDIVHRLAEATDFPARRFREVLASPGPIGLPAYADGNAEGYLFPATYAFPPKSTPTTILTTMVDRWRQAVEETGLVARARELGYTPGELMIIASLIEAEARGPDMPKVARVIYNRLETEGSPTFGLLQIDASVNYGLQQDLGVALTREQLEQDTPYNTYTRTGLPPTPIEAPGAAAIEAAANPARGGWYFYVTVNLRTGETKFAETLREFNRYKAEFREYCTTSDAC